MNRHTLSNAEKLRALKSNAIQTITSNTHEWIKYLEFTARHYKYPAIDQILIYAQDPQAVAVARFDQWHDIFNRRISRGAIAIRLLSDQSPNGYTACHFDMRDTYGTNNNLLWSIPQDDQEQVLRLAWMKFRNDSAEPTYVDLLSETIKGKIDDHLIEIDPQNEYDIDKELLEDFLIHCAALVIGTRVNLETAIFKAYISKHADIISEFSAIDATEDVLDILSTINKKMLLTIERMAREYARDQNNSSRSTTNQDSKRDNVLPSAPTGRHTDLRFDGESRPTGAESSAVSTQSEVLSQIPDLSGESVSKSAGETQENADPNISIDEDRRGMPDIRNNNAQTSDGEERAGGSTANGLRDESSHDRTTQEPDRGNSSDPNVGEVGSQTLTPHPKLKAADENQEAVFFAAQNTDTAQLSLFATEKSIDELRFEHVFLHVGPPKRNGPLRIANYIQAGHTKTEITNFIKKEYGFGCNMLKEYGLKWFFYSSKGTEFEGYDLADEIYQIKYSWSHVANKIIEYVESGVYFPDECSMQNPFEIAEETSLPSDTTDTITAQELEHITDNAIISIDDIDSSDQEEEHITDHAISSSDNIEPSDRQEEHDIIHVIDSSNDIKPSDYETPSTVKGRYKVNAVAIKTLRILEKENRPANALERANLAKYCGWGGSSQVFDEKNNTYNEQYTELKELLNEQEYAAARASTLSSFYTKPFIIKEIYSTLQSFGFKGGKILDPSMGVGAFFQHIPTNMLKNSSLYGVELDKITGSIASKLFPKANIQVKGFEEFNHPDNSFDLVISNIPFGSYKVADSRYSNNLFIHDYFFAKALDQVRPDGMVVFITSKGVLDKLNSDSRRYIAERAKLIGAVRLPTSAFYDTDVTTDIIFLQKREQLVKHIPDWVYTTELPNGIVINSHYSEHPDRLLGEMVFDSSMYGSDKQTALHPFKDKNLEELLHEALLTLEASYIEKSTHEQKEDKEIPADPSVKNFSYTLVGDQVYYRENSFMTLQEFRNDKAKQRVIGHIQIKEALLEVIESQKLACSDAELAEAQKALNEVYDHFVTKHGYLTDTANMSAFSQDCDCCLLLSLESKGKEGVISKADIFTKRTIKVPKATDNIPSAIDALALSINYRDRVDLDYMSSLYGKPIRAIIEELQAEIYLNPAFYNPNDITHGWETANKYLSGNVRQKLAEAKLFEEQHPGIFSSNVKALEANQPVDIPAGEISVRLSSPWIERKYINQFMYQLLDTPIYLQERSWSDSGHVVKAQYNNISGEWSVVNKNRAPQSVKATQIYGTSRIHAYQIIEDTLNLRTVTIKDRVDDCGTVRYVYNHKESTLAREKQNKIKNEFEQWIFAQTERRDLLVSKYNDTYNNLKLREYDGSRLEFPGMNASIKLYSHQRNAIARIREGNNTLLAHVVGAGKTYTMICGAKEQLRLGIATKAAFIVPNHLIDQMTADIYTLYPSSKVLKASKKDFEKKNRQKFLSKIAFSDVEIVVMGHSQFEKISMSDEYREEQIHNDIGEIVSAIDTLKSSRGEGYTIKQLERLKTNLEVELKSLTDSSKKDQHITFEQLGINSLFVDEAHYYKNGAIFSKMTNVAGISASKAKKASDMLMKCRYISERNGSITFATGTPISNTMCETYIMQRYLQNDLLLEKGIRHFDEWASNFGETKTSLELSPEGNSFRMKTRFSSFYNLPELMQMFKAVADIQTADMLDLPVPKLATGKPIVVVSKPSFELECFMKESIVRASRIRDRLVKPHEDNMLKFTGDAKKAGLDMRLIDPESENDPNGKISKCAGLLYKHYTETKDTKGVQIVFCDTSTPGSKQWNVYTELKQQAIELGIDQNEIAFIHDANSEQDKELLFTKCRSGEVRVLIGSTQKCGAGTNIQERLIALHHLDCPYRPSDIEQREGRILRQGNTNEEVYIYRYVTEKSFDAYLWSLVANKAKFIAQIMNSKTIIDRSCEDIDEAILNYAEVQAIASGNPLIKEKIEIDNEVNKLQLLKASFVNERYTLQDSVDKEYPQKIAACQEMIAFNKQDIANRAPKANGDDFTILISGRIIVKRDDAGTFIIMLFSNLKPGDPHALVGSYRGFNMYLHKDAFSGLPFVTLKGAGEYRTEVSLASNSGITTRLDNALDRLEAMLEQAEGNLQTYQLSLQAAKEQLTLPFEHEEKLNKLVNRQTEINITLDVNSKDGEDVTELDEQPNNPIEAQADEHEDEEEMEL